ncbi:hypothetical protein [Paraburkholderia ribeironis]|uniref:hypothetical protein n=1 Tax=Paraburkholderia ribeironis TaxID=1247936 RepID=UPI001177A5FA|nr:hypothetical protein [Paraburkholderia ribeironis]
MDPFHPLFDAFRVAGNFPHVVCGTSTSESLDAILSHARQTEHLSGYQCRREELPLDMQAAMKADKCIVLTAISVGNIDWASTFLNRIRIGMVCDEGWNISTLLTFGKGPWQLDPHHFHYTLLNLQQTLAVAFISEGSWIVVNYHWSREKVTQLHTFAWVSGLNILSALPEDHQEYQGLLTVHHRDYHNATSGQIGEYEYDSLPSLYVSEDYSNSNLLFPIETFESPAVQGFVDGMPQPTVFGTPPPSLPWDEYVAYAATPSDIPIARPETVESTAPVFASCDYLLAHDDDAGKSPSGHEASETEEYLMSYLRVHKSFTFHNKTFQ